MRIPPIRFGVLHPVNVHSPNQTGIDGLEAYEHRKVQYKTVTVQVAGLQDTAQFNLIQQDDENGLIRLIAADDGSLLLQRSDLSLPLMKRLPSITQDVFNQVGQFIYAMPFPEEVKTFFRAAYYQTAAREGYPTPNPLPRKTKPPSA